MAIVKALSVEPQTSVAIQGIVVGAVHRVDEDGTVWVDHAMNPTEGPLRAAYSVALSPTDKGARVALSFEQDDPTRPLVIGKMHEPKMHEPTEPKAWETEVDEEQVVLTAKKQIVLRCGRARIILTQDGKVILHGAYILSRSRGGHDIQGASVKINS